MTWAIVETLIRISTAAAVVIAVIKFSRDAGMMQERLQKLLTEAVETVKRLELLVEGNPKEHVDQLKRDGVLGRMKDLEHKEKSRVNAEAIDDDLQKQAFAQVWKWIRAILRGMGVPSDISKTDRLEREIKKRFIEAKYVVDRLGAGVEMQEHPQHSQHTQSHDRPSSPYPEHRYPSDRLPTGPHQSLRLPPVDYPERHSPIERVPRPKQVGSNIPREDPDSDEEDNR